MTQEEFGKLKPGDIVKIVKEDIAFHKQREFKVNKMIAVYGYGMEGITAIFYSPQGELELFAEEVEKC